MWSVALLQRSGGALGLVGSASVTDHTNQSSSADPLQWS